MKQSIPPTPKFRQSAKPAVTLNSLYRERAKRHVCKLTDNMFLFRFCILLVLSVLALGAPQNVYQSRKKCKITDDIQGECILLPLCPRAVELLSIKDIKTLRSLTCGFDKLDTKVCCVTRRTDEALTFNNQGKDPQIWR